MIRRTVATAASVLLLGLFCDAGAQSPPAGVTPAPAAPPYSWLASVSLASGASGSVAVGQMLHVTSGAASAKAITAPSCTAGIDGQFFGVADEIGNAQTYNDTVTPNSGSIAGLSSAILNVNGEVQVWRCHGSTTNWLPIENTAGAPSPTPVQSLAATSHSFTAADFYQKTRRSNSGSAMSDSFPSSAASGMVNGARLDIANIDASASDTLTAGAGTTIAGNSTYAIPAGRDVLFLYSAGLDEWLLDANTGSAVISGESCGGDLGGTYPNCTVTSGSHLGAGTTPLSALQGTVNVGAGVATYAGAYAYQFASVAALEANTNTSITAAYVPGYNGNGLGTMGWLTKIATGKTASDANNCSTFVDAVGQEWQVVDSQRVVDASWGTAGNSSNDTVGFERCINAITYDGAASNLTARAAIYNLYGLSSEVTATITGDELSISAFASGDPVVALGETIAAPGGNVTIVGFGTGAHGGENNNGSYYILSGSPGNVSTPTNMAASLPRGIDFPAIGGIRFTAGTGDFTAQGNIGAILVEGAHTLDFGYSGILGYHSTAATYPALEVAGPNAEIDHFNAVYGTHNIQYDQFAGDDVSFFPVASGYASGSSSVLDLAGVWQHSNKFDTSWGPDNAMASDATEPALLPTSGSLALHTPYVVTSQQSSFIGSISGYTLTIGEGLSGLVANGDVIHCTGCAPGTIVLAGAGTTTLTVFPAQTVAGATMTSDIDYVFEVTAAGAAGGTWPSPPFVSGADIAYGAATIAFWTQWPYYALQTDTGNSAGAPGESSFDGHIDMSGAFSAAVGMTNNGGGAPFYALNLDYPLFGGYSGLALYYGTEVTMEHGHGAGGVIGPNFGSLIFNDMPAIATPIVIDGGSGVLSGITAAGGFAFGPNVAHWIGQGNTTGNNGGSVTGVSFSSGDDYINWLGNDQSASATASSGVSNLGANSNYQDNIGDSTVIVQGTAAVTCSGSPTSAFAAKSGITTHC